MNEVKWLVELWRENKPALFLYGETRESIARAIIDADDYYGEFGTSERMAKCWTPNALQANTYSEAGAKQTAEALGRCCGGVAVAVDHLFINDIGEPRGTQMKYLLTIAASISYCVFLAWIGGVELERSPLMGAAVGFGTLLGLGVITSILLFEADQ